MKTLVLIVIAVILLGIGNGLKEMRNQMAERDCSDAVSAYQHRLEKEIEKLRGFPTHIKDYDYGWEDALDNVLPLLK